MGNPQILARGWDPVSPADAGWTFISFGVHTLSAGESLSLAADGQERALVPLSGTASVACGDQQWKLGGRGSVFDGRGHCLSLPLNSEASVTAVTDLEIAVAAAPATVRHEAVLVTPDDPP